MTSREKSAIFAHAENTRLERLVRIASYQLNQNGHKTLAYKIKRVVYRSQWALGLAEVGRLKYARMVGY